MTWRRKATRLNLARIASATRAAGILALAALCAAGLAVFFTWAIFSSQFADRGKQVVLHARAALARQVKGDLERWVERVSAGGRDLILKIGTQSGLAYRVPVQGFTQDPEFMDLSLWIRSPGATTGSGAPVLATYQAQLRKGVSVPLPSTPEELEAIERAFEGTPSGLFREGAAGVWNGGFMLAVPVRAGAEPSGQKASDVVVVHLQMERFQAVFKKDGPLRSALLDSKGKFLAVSESFLEARQGRYYGGPQALGVAGLQVSLLAPREEIEVSWWQATDQTLLFFAGFFGLSFLLFTALCLMGGARWLARVELGRRSVGRATGPSLESAPATVILPLAPQATPTPSTSNEPETSGDREARNSERWFVNNGTAVQGPMTAEEISQKLYVQEVDFDCVCWNESADPATGTLVLRETDLFLPGIPEALGLSPEVSRDPDEPGFWIFKSGRIFGPLTEGQVDLLVRKLPVSADQEIPAEMEIQICVDSTVQGWKWLGAWAREVQWPKPYRRKGSSKDKNAADDREITLAEAIGLSAPRAPASDSAEAEREDSDHPEREAA